MGAYLVNHLDALFFAKAKIASRLCVGVRLMRDHRKCTRSSDGQSICWIFSGEDQAPITCHIKEIHHNWASIDCPASDQVPHYFSLSVAADNRKTPRKCRTVFRSKSELVLKFID